MKHQGIGMTSQRTRNRLIERLREGGIQDPRVLDVLRQTPRHVFMDEAMASRAYEDTALPIGHGQTISQPFIVARMTEVLLDQPTPPSKVLEIGTGSGYQTAVLAQLVDQVYTVERISQLLNQARQRLQSLQLTNMQYRMGDGYQGWEKQAPFDAIIVTAAPETLPKELLQQLTVGGRMVIPVGQPLQQRLMLIVRQEEGFSEQALDWVSFVPMIKGQAS
ncbi:MAG: protein-L-isoaspartate(D-aspartate) O-methyltransferase [Gammaproteobacteria bacterium]|nr:protein-L-isoaspartate(D-aspartate) O-methyltransferase [Gammaproteobacteria bacterium]